MENTFKKLNNEWGNIDFVVHAIAFADKDELKGKYASRSNKIYILNINNKNYCVTLF